MEKVESYLSIFRRNLLVGNRDQLVLEMREQIMAQINEDESNVDEVLEKYGSPIKLALTYQHSSKTLIGQEYYTSFIAAQKRTIKITNIVYLIAYLTLVTVEIITFKGNLLFFDVAFTFMSGLITVNIIAILVVLAIFAFIERYGFDEANQNNWRVTNLSKLAANNNVSITEIIFTIVIYVIIFQLMMQLFAGITFNNQHLMVFNPAARSAFIISYIVSGGEEIIALLKMKRRPVILFAQIILNGIVVLLSYIILINLQLVDIRLNGVQLMPDNNLNISLFFIVLLIVSIRVIILLCYLIANVFNASIKKDNPNQIN